MRIMHIGTLNSSAAHSFDTDVLPFNSGTGRLDDPKIAVTGNNSGFVTSGDYSSVLNKFYFLLTANSNVSIYEFTLYCENPSNYLPRIFFLSSMDLHNHLLLYQ